MFKRQEEIDRAIEQFRLAFEIENTHDTAFEIGQLYVDKGVFTAALDFFTFAIESANLNVLAIAPNDLSKYYLARARCYEALNLYEHAKADNRKILEADPGFIQRQLHANKLA